jgi:energy-coupling factor transport system permease protein
MLANFSYINRNSFVHRLDPRTKIILLFAYSFIVIQTSNVWIIAIGFTLAIIYYFLAHLKWKETKQTWRLILSISIGLALVNYILSAGNILQGVDVGHIHILLTLPFIGFRAQAPYLGIVPMLFSVESLVFLLTQLLRNVSIAAIAILIPFTIDPDQMGVAFKGIGLPDKFAYAVDLSFRFLPTVFRDFDMTMAAQQARGFELERRRGGLIKKIIRITPLILPVVIGSILGSDDIINAMELRCFGVGKRTWLTKLHLVRVDYLLIVGSTLVFFSVTLLNILGNYYPYDLLHMIHTQGIAPLLTR